MKIAFIHLDLGIGGAESLVVAAAVGLQEKGHEISMFTAHCDPSHAFEPVKDGTLKVEVLGGFLPRAIFGKFIVLMAVLRMSWICAVLWYRGVYFDVIFNDQVSAINPLIRLLLKPKKSIFYCHYPDAFLCVDRISFLKRLYRIPFDWLEKVTISSCTHVLVNSLFTAGILKKFAPNAEPIVIYPPCGVGVETDEPGNFSTEADLKFPQGYLLSLNRFERKKNVALALKAFAEFGAKNADEKIGLVIAGGFDSRVPENRENLAELSKLAADLEISSHVLFLTSVSDSVRRVLLSKALAVVYTPSLEHFGIVPCEAMAVGTPVIACNDGGPRESVVDGETGWLCESGDVAAFSKAMQKATHLTQRARRRMADAGIKRVKERFSVQSFVRQLDKLLLL